MSQCSTRPKATEWPKIRPCRNAWRVDCGFKLEEGKRVQREFPTEDEAKKFAQECRERRRLLEESTRLQRRNSTIILTNLSDSQRRDVHRAYELLDNHGSLVEAVEFFMKHMAPRKAIILADLYQEYLEAKHRAKLRPKSLEDIESRVGRMVQDLGTRQASGIFPADLESWLDSHRYEGVTRIGYRRQFIGFFNYAVQHEYCPSNPAKKLTKPHLDETTPGIHTIAQVKKILNTAEVSCPEMIPFIVIGYFAGVRPGEICPGAGKPGLTWNHIDLEEKEIKVIPQVAKARRQRNVEILPNLHAWLAKYKSAENGGPSTADVVYYSRRKLRNLIQDSGVAWSHDVLRHCYGSYHYAAFQNPGKTATEMGHTDIDTLHNHYRALVRKVDAQKYWGIYPSEN